MNQPPEGFGVSLAQLQSWIAACTTGHIVLGYGSLMNADSRQRFSSIPYSGIPVRVHGYHRAWITRSEEEQQTYVGALEHPQHYLNAQLIITTMNPALSKREQDYTFEPVEMSQLQFGLGEELVEQLTHTLKKRHLWICRTRDAHPANNDYPVSQSYVDTCIAGCLEHGGEREAVDFITTTGHWSHPRVQDRQRPRYPRAGRVSAQMQVKIDALLEELL